MAHLHAGDVHGARVAAQIESSQRAEQRGDGFKRGGVVAPENLLLRIAVVHGTAVAGGVEINFHHAIGLGIRKRAQYRSVDHGEDGGVRADAESERENRDEAEARRAAQRAQAEACVGDEMLEPGNVARVAAFFRAFRYAAELKQSAPASFVARDALRHVEMRLLLDVVAQLVVEVGVNFRAVKERAQPQLKFVDPSRLRHRRASAFSDAAPLFKSKRCAPRIKPGVQKYYRSNRYRFLTDPLK